MFYARFLLVLLAIGFVIMLFGCLEKNKSKIFNIDTTTKETLPTSREHLHQIGPHGGLVSGVGLDDKLHVELVIDKSKHRSLLFYILGEDEKTDFNIPAQLMEAIAIGEDDRFETTPVIPSKSGLDLSGQVFTNDHLFIGNLPSFAIKKVILRLKVGESSHNVSWNVMSDTLLDSEESEICLKPGGVYTLEDIEANGNIVPSAKFKGMVFPHDPTKPGDKLCPITGVKADEDVGGKLMGKNDTTVVLHVVLLMSKEQKRSGKGCWYYQFVEECVACGKTLSKGKERRQGPKPIDTSECYGYSQHLCSSCMMGDY